jgi:ABC-type multidrug transport system ATPase subunit
LQSQPLLEASRAYVQAVVSEMVLPEGYSIEMIEAEEETIYYWMMGIAALLIFMILASLFESLSAPLVILCTLPAAILGSCWALILSGTGLTSQEAPMALLGLIVLSGIAVNNGIVLIDAIETLRRRGFRRERAVLAASRSRVRPVLMTSATTILGMLPLALIFGGDYEIWPPFAIVVIGGLAVSTVSTLVFIPVVYMGIDQTKAWLADIGWFGIVLGTAAAAGLTHWVNDYYQSLFWTCLLALPAWMLCMGTVWIVQRIYRARMASLIEIGNIEHLEIRNLTKIYGAPGQFKREWDRFKRRDERLSERGQVVVDKKAIKDSLWWKLPLLALLIYLETYFEQGSWIFLTGLALWGLVHHLVLCAATLRDFQIENRWISQIARLILPLVFVAFIHWRLELISLTIATSTIYLLYRIIGFLANRVGQGRVDPEHIPGKLGPVKGIVYRGAAAVPLIGVPRPQFQALGGVSLDIPRGMFGLLGPNGAGKTTLMRIVCRVLSSNYGSVLANGKIPLTHRNMQGVIGYLPQHFGLYLHMSAYNYLEYRALLEGFKDGVARRKRVQECLEQVNLWDRRDDPIGSFSGGMKQRVGIAQTLLHLPQIIVVDEPTAGLDPLERIRFRNLLARFSQEKIIIFSTHIVEDIAGSCNRLAVLNHGKVLYTGTPIEMRDLARDKVWEALLPDQRFEALERDLDMITHVRVPDGIRVRFLATDPIPEARAATPTLEDAYLYLLRHGDEYKQANMA